MIFFSELRKNVKDQPIESYKPRERYQADIIIYQNYEWDWFKYIFTMMDYFTNYGWVIPLNHSKVETILIA